MRASVGKGGRRMTRVPGRKKSMYFLRWSLLGGEAYTERRFA